MERNLSVWKFFKTTFPLQNYIKCIYIEYAFYIKRKKFSTKRLLLLLLLCINSKKYSITKRCSYQLFVFAMKYVIYHRANKFDRGFLKFYKTLPLFRVVRHHFTIFIP